MTEYIIHERRGWWGVWASEPNWRDKEAISPYFIYRHQAEDYEAQLIEAEILELEKGTL